MDAVGVLLRDSELDNEELASLALSLRDELLDTDVYEVLLAAVETRIPQGAKGVELAAFGSLLVKIIAKVDVAKVVSTIREWLVRQHLRSIEVTLDGDTLKLTNVTSEEQDRLVALWVSRHAEAE